MLFPSWMQFPVASLLCSLPKTWLAFLPRLLLGPIEPPLQNINHFPQMQTVLLLGRWKACTLMNSHAVSRLKHWPSELQSKAWLPRTISWTVFMCLLVSCYKRMALQFLGQYAGRNCLCLAVSFVAVICKALVGIQHTCYGHLIIWHGCLHSREADCMLWCCPCPKC